LASIFIISVPVSLHFSNVQISYGQQHSYNNQQNNNSALNFTKYITLTNNSADSVYSKVAAFGNDVYVVWQQLVSHIASMENASNNDGGFVANGSNYDIFIKKSSDGGVTFDKSINLSNNSGFSEHPHLAVYGNNVYVTWIDYGTYTNYKKGILFRKSNDGGQTFSNIIHLDRFDSHNNMYDINNSKLGNSNNPEISAFGNKVYVVWNQEPPNYNNNGNNTNRLVYKILFRASDNGGSTFKNIKILSNNVSSLTYPKINTSPTNNGDNVYIVWNTGFSIGDQTRNTNSIFFTKSNNNGDSFSNSTKINGPIKSIGKPQIIHIKITYTYYGLESLILQLDLIYIIQKVLIMVIYSQIQFPLMTIDH